MRIVHCFFTLEMGGAQVLAVDLLNELCARHETALIAVNDLVNEGLLQKLDKRVTIYRINRKEGSRNPLPLLYFNTLLLKLRPHIIHIHEPDIGRIIKAPIGKKLYTIHDTGIPTTYYHLYDSLIAISDAVQRDVSSRLNRPIATVYNGIATSSFRQRTQYAVNNEPIKLVQLSRLMHEKKGQDLLLHALQLIKEQFGFSEFSLDFIGIGPSMEYLKTLTEQLQLVPQVRFLGEQNRDWLYAHLADYHLLVQPSRYEGFGLTLLEGFAAGLPVLASNIEGPAEIISHTARGFLFEKDNIADCAAQLYGLFKDFQKGHITTLFQSNPSVTEQQYSIKACVAGYEKAYNELMK